MSRLHSYISTAVKIVESYKPGQPLSHHIRHFFSLDKKYGSKDRKTIASLCYAYFRISTAFPGKSLQEIMLLAIFLCEHQPNDFLKLMKPEWNEKVTMPVIEKLAFLSISPENLFAFYNELSSGIERDLFSCSMLIQPAVFARIRPGKKTVVLKKLEEAGIAHELIDEECLSFKQQVALDKVLQPDKELVIQDLNSQKVFDFLKNSQLEKAPAVWDCCAASGGKSLLLYDILKGKLKLTVSDIRQNILANLGSRLQHAGISLYRKFCADLALKSGLEASETFQIIICDAPCTGSGTWSRTPEQLFSFRRDQIEGYNEKQKQIVSHTIPHLELKGYFFYITCSVFTSENETMVEFIQEKFHLQLLKMEYLTGYDKAADTMFVAVFMK